jgi:aminoglycoside 6'-N-acetyltransferase
VSGFEFRPLQRCDFALLSQWLATPHVARWWDDDPSLAALEADYGGSIDGTEPCQVFIACCDGAPLGFAQRYLWHAYPDYVAELAPIMAAPAAACSIDYFIGPVAALGRGLGTRMIAAFARKVWHDGTMNASCILVPTHADNRASWRTLERAGFERVAEGELTPDNPADDRRHFIYRIDRPA